MLADYKLKFWKINLWKFEEKYPESNVSKWDTSTYHVIATETQIIDWKKKNENEVTRINLKEITMTDLSLIEL
jgi:hypothetical protein